MKKETEVATVETSRSEPPALAAARKRKLVLEGDPEVQLAFATKAANALMKVVKPKKINGRDYLEFGAWQTLGRFFGSTVGTEWTKKIEREQAGFIGYEARSVVMQHGEVISSAEAMCSSDERNWKGRDEFAIRSMAQTRASAKALRNAYGWVAELAGFASTPAEEMSYEQDVVPVQKSIFEVAKNMIARTTDTHVLNEYWKKISGSDKYSDDEKSKLEGIIAARVEELTNKEKEIQV